MTEKKTKSVPFRLTPTRHRELLHVLADRGQGFQELLEEGLRLLLEKPPKDFENKIRLGAIPKDDLVYTNDHPDISRWIDALAEMRRFLFSIRTGGVSSAAIERYGEARAVPRVPTAEEVQGAERSAEEARSHSGSPVQKKRAGR